MNISRTLNELFKLSFFEVLKDLVNIGKIEHSLSSY